MVPFTVLSDSHTGCAIHLGHSTNRSCGHVNYGAKIVTEIQEYHKGFNGEQCEQGHRC